MKMKYTCQSGFVTILVSVVALIVLVGSGIYLLNRDNASNGESVMDDETMMEEDVMMDDEKMDDGDAMKNIEDSDAMMESDDESMMEGDEMMMEDSASFTGKVLAGNSALLLDFNQSDYEKALSLNKKIVLYFYANWCPICKAEFPKMQEAFNTLERDDVIAFRVNYNDNETDKDEEALARENGVAYQHTKVFIKDGKRVLKSPESWDKNRYIEELNNFI